MIDHIFKRFFALPIGLFAVFPFIGCNGQTDTSKDCRTQFKNALKGLNTYYKNNDTSYLIESLNNVEQSIKCPETKYRSIDLKITLLSLLKKYQWGYEFVDSMSDNDFKPAYKKKINYDYFRALDYGSRSDTLDRNIFLSDLVNNIEQYIQKENLPKDTLDEGSYYLLFTFKKELLGIAQVNSEIDSLKKSFPHETEYLDVVKSSLDDKPHIGEPLRLKPD